VAEVDGAYFGGYIKPANEKKNRRDLRKAENKNGKEKVVVAIRERNGRTVPQVFRSEAESDRFLRSRIAKGTVIHVDEGTGWNPLHGIYQVSRINHSRAYSLNGSHINGAESFFSRIRRAEIGHHHHMAGPYLVRFAQEAAWREDHKRHSNGEQVSAVTRLALKTPPSVDFGGYWQRARSK
jgi:hypothetical protein